MKFWFVYKPVQSSFAGSAMPLAPTTGALGLGSYLGWYVGWVDSAESGVYLNRIKEFNPLPLTESAAAGIPLLAAVANPTEPRTYTPTELQHISDAKDVITKILVRPTVQCLVGDVDDQMADMAKRVAIIERCVIFMYAKEARGAALPDLWKNLMDRFYDDYVAGRIKDPVDVRPDGILSVYEILKARCNTLTGIMAEYYQGVNIK